MLSTLNLPWAYLPVILQRAEVCLRLEHFIPLPVPQTAVAIDADYLTGVIA